MAIVFSCECGKQFRAQEKHAGKQMRCRRCGATITIPQLSTADEIEDVTDTQPAAPVADALSEIVVSLDTPDADKPRDPFEADWLARLEAMTREQAEQLIEAPPDSETDDSAVRISDVQPPPPPLEVMPADDELPPAREPPPPRRRNPLLDKPSPKVQALDDTLLMVPPAQIEPVGPPSQPGRPYNPLLDGARPEEPATDTTILSTAAPAAATQRRFPWGWVVAATVTAVLLLLLAGGAYWWLGLNLNSATDIGAPAVRGSTTRIDDQSYDVLAGGKDIWGSRDQFHLYGKPLSGDFDIQTHVAFAGGTGATAKAGLMARESLDPASRNVAVLATPGEPGCWMQVRRATASDTFNFKGKDAFSDRGMWVRLTRVGNEFTASSSTDGKAWNPVGRETLELPPKLYVGLAASAGDEKTSIQIRFRNFTHR
jgi:regulation of enolase protein 1 (concanavalin A-like superfamily)